MFVYLFVPQFAAMILQRIMGDPTNLNLQIHNPDSDLSHFTSESVNPRNLDLMGYGCEICPVTDEGALFTELFTDS